MGLAVEEVDVVEDMIRRRLRIGLNTSDAVGFVASSILPSLLLNSSTDPIGRYPSSHIRVCLDLLGLMDQTDLGWLENRLQNFSKHWLQKLCSA